MQVLRPIVEIAKVLDGQFGMAIDIPQHPLDQPMAIFQIQREVEPDEPRLFVHGSKGLRPSYVSGKALAAGVFVAALRTFGR